MNSPVCQRAPVSSWIRSAAISFVTIGLLLSMPGVASAVILVVKSDDLPQYNSPTNAFSVAYAGEIVELNLEGSREEGEARLRKAAGKHDIRPMR